jgi:hypothetical protein
VAGEEFVKKVSLEFDFDSNSESLVIKCLPKGQIYHLLSGETLTVEQDMGKAKIIARTDPRIDFKRTGDFTSLEEREIFDRIAEEVVTIRDVKPIGRLREAVKG